MKPPFHPLFLSLFFPLPLSPNHNGHIDEYYWMVLLSSYTRGRILSFYLRYHLSFLCSGLPEVSIYSFQVAILRLVFRLQYFSGVFRIASQTVCFLGVQDELDQGYIHNFG